MVLSIVNTNNSILFKSFVCSQLNDFKYCYLNFKMLVNIIHLFARS